MAVFSGFQRFRGFADADEQVALEDLCYDPFMETSDAVRRVRLAVISFLAAVLLTALAIT